MWLGELGFVVAIELLAECTDFFFVPVYDADVCANDVCVLRALHGHANKVCIDRQYSDCFVVV